MEMLFPTVGPKRKQTINDDLTRWLDIIVTDPTSAEDDAKRITSVIQSRYYKTDEVAFAFFAANAIILKLREEARREKSS